MKLCDYGCGKESMYLLNNGKACCSDHYNKCEALRKKNSDGLKRAHKDGKIHNFTDEERTKWSRGKNRFMTDKIKSGKSSNIDDYLSNKVPTKTILLKKDLLNLGLLEYKCSTCGLLPMWNNKPIALELHHKDGNNKNNNLDNLEILCPNCHSQTRNFRSRNTDKKEWKIIVNKNVLIECIENAKSLNEAVRKYEEITKQTLPISSYRYHFLKKFMEEHNISIAQNIL